MSGLEKNTFYLLNNRFYFVRDKMMGSYNLITNIGSRSDYYYRVHSKDVVKKVRIK